MDSFGYRVHSALIMNVARGHQKAEAEAESKYFF